MATEPDAHYFDGASTTPQPARVTVMPDALLIQTPSGTAHWKLSSIRRVPGPETLGMRLASDDAADARLTVLSPAAIDRVLDAAPRLARSGATWRSKSKALKWVAGGIAGLALLGFGAFEGAPRIAAYTPMEWVEPIGDNVRSQIEFVFGASECATPAADAALQQLTTRLLAGVEPSARFNPEAIHVRIAKSDIPNALAAPGGHIVILGGLFDLTGNDPDLGGDMLAGVLAHEIAHARLRHPTRALGRALGLDLLVRASGGGVGADGGVILASFAYGRAAEREADALAYEMLTRAGIGDAGLKAFFAKLNDDYGDEEGESSFFSTHPSSAERSDVLPGEDGAERAFTDAEWRALFSACKS